VAVIECKELGLAAFIKMKGHKLVSCVGRVYKFECETEVFRDLELEYANSCCRIHDATVMNLRQLQN
jgi:hypothetical protein